MINMKNIIDKITKYQETKELTLRNELVIEHIDFIKSIAEKMAIDKGISPEELLTPAYEGFVIALNNFNGSEASFELYAKKCIKGRILDELPLMFGYMNKQFYYDYDRCKREVLEIEGIVDQNIESDIRTLRKIYNYMKENNLYPRLKFIDFISRVTISYPDVLDAENDVEDKFSFDDQIDKIDLNMLKEYLYEILDTLSEEERIVIIERFGLNGDFPKTLEEIGEKIGKSRERIRQIERKALYRLKFRTPKLEELVSKIN